MGKGTYMGGYVDFEYRSRQDAKQKFEVIRMVPFIYADIAPGIRFATEIEFEHGGPQSLVPRVKSQYSHGLNVKRK